MGEVVLRTRRFSCPCARPFWEVGMFPSPEPRLILRIGDPLIGDTFLAIAGPHETRRMGGGGDQTAEGAPSDTSAP